MRSREKVTNFVRTRTPNQKLEHRVEVLPVTLAHVLALQSLPLHHKDPFDHLLIAQAQVENAVLVSKDAVLGQYAVPLFW